MASCEVKPELWINRFHQIKDQLVVGNPSERAQDVDRQARAIFMETIYVPDVRSIVSEWDRKPIIAGPTYKVTLEGLTCLYAGKEIPLRKLAVDNIREQTPQNYNPTEEKILVSAERAILQAPTAEVVFPVYNQDGKIRYLSQWRRKDNLVETAMIDISQDGQDKTLEEAKTLMEKMAKEKKGRIQTDKDNREVFILDSQPDPRPRSSALPFLERISLMLAKSDKQVELPVNLAEAVEISFPTVLHRTVGNNIPDSKKTVVAVTTAVAEPLFMPFQSVQPTIQVTPIMPAIEQTSMIPSQRELAISKIASIIEENSETVKPIFKEESAIYREPTVTVKAKFEQTPVFKLMVSETAKESPAMVKTQTAPVFQPAEERGQTVVAEKAVIGVAQTEQQPVFEKAVAELSLPLLAISSETAPMAIKAALKPVLQISEPSAAFDFETDLMAMMKREKPKGEKIVLIDDQLPIPTEKKVIVGVNQKQSKLFLVENFSLVSAEAAKTEKKPDWQIKKLVWRIKASTPEPKEASIVEFELPKDQNQRLYAFWHFLQKAVRKVVGQDAIRTRQVTVIAEKEDVNFDLELIGEIEYYLELLRRKRNYAQAFAVVN